jgi:hypothetical protein
MPGRLVKRELVGICTLIGRTLYQAQCWKDQKGSIEVARPSRGGRQLMMRGVKIALDAIWFAVSWPFMCANQALFGSSGPLFVFDPIWRSENEADSC